MTSKGGWWLQKECGCLCQQPLGRLQGLVGSLGKLAGTPGLRVSLGMASRTPLDESHPTVPSRGEEAQGVISAYIPHAPVYISPIFPHCQIPAVFTPRNVFETQRQEKEDRKKDTWVIQNVIHLQREEDK